MASPGPLDRPQQLFGDYWERQESAGCGRHALNNFFGAKLFIKEAVPPIELDKDTFKNLGGTKSDGTIDLIPLQSLCRYLSKFEKFDETPGTPLKCPSNEFYDSAVMQQALGVLGYSAFEPEVISGVASREWKKTKDTKDTDVLGYIVNISKYHWVALRKLPDGNYKYIDSGGTSDKPPYHGEIMSLNQFKYRASRSPKDVDIPSRIETALEIKHIGTFQDLTEGAILRSTTPHAGPVIMSPESIIALGRESYQKITGGPADTDIRLFKGQITGLFSTNPAFNSCYALKDFLTEKNTASSNFELLKEETIDYWNVMNAYLQIDKNPDDPAWKKNDEQYETLAEAYRLTKFNKGIIRFDKELMRGGLRPQRKSTDIFNKSLTTNDDIKIEEFNRKIARTEKKILDEINYFDTKYSAGITSIGKSSSTKLKQDTKYINELLGEAYDQEKEKSKYIDDIAHPEHRFEKILNKFKTESQLVSWLEKAKTENIKATAESKKANQKLKALSTMKESIDDCVEKMKKTLNYKCDMIMQYRNILDQSKQLEINQKTIVDLAALMVDPGRGIDNARDAMAAIGIDAVSNGLIEYFGGLEFPTYETIKNIYTDPMPEVVKFIKTDLFPKFKKLSEDPLLTKIAYIKDEMSFLKTIVDSMKLYEKEMNPATDVSALKKYLNDKFLVVYLRNYTKLEEKIKLLNAILTTKSSGPVLPEILRKRQETGDLREEIKDTLEELNEAKSSPIDVSKCIDEYKKVVARENTDLEKEIGRIDTATDDLLKKMPQSIEDLKNQIKLNLNQGGPGGPGGPGGQGPGGPGGPGGQGQGKIIKLDQVKSITSIADIVTALSNIGNAIKDAENKSKANPANTDLVANILRMNQTKDALIKRKIDLEKTPVLGGGSRAYAHSTRRYIRR